MTTNKDKLMHGIVNDIECYRYNAHTTFDDGIDAAIEILNSLRSAAVKKPLRRKLYSKSEWLESLKRPWWKRAVS